MEVNKYWFKAIELEVCTTVYYIGVELLHVLKMDVGWDCNTFFILIWNTLNEFILEKK